MANELYKAFVNAGFATEARTLSETVAGKVVPGLGRYIVEIEEDINFRIETGLRASLYEKTGDYDIVLATHQDPRLSNPDKIKIRNKRVKEAFLKINKFLHENSTEINKKAGKQIIDTSFPLERTETISEFVYKYAPQETN